MFQEVHTMDSHKSVHGYLYGVTEAARMDIEIGQKERRIVDVTSCECGLPRLYCDDYCGIDCCDWLVY